MANLVVQTRSDLFQKEVKRLLSKSSAITWLEAVCKSLLLWFGTAILCIFLGGSKNGGKQGEGESKNPGKQKVCIIHFKNIQISKPKT